MKISSILPHKFAILLISVLVVSLMSCSKGTFDVSSVRLDPVLVFGPDSRMDMAALYLEGSSGGTHVASVTLSSDDGLYSWNYQADDASQPRLPQAGEGDFSAPWFAIDDDTDLVFFYPWFLGPGGNALPSGRYTVVVMDFARNQADRTIQYRAVPPEQLREAEEAIRMYADGKALPTGSWYFLMPGETSNQAQNPAALLLDLREVPEGHSYYLWGVYQQLANAAGDSFEILILAGPYIRQE